MDKPEPILLEKIVAGISSAVVGAEYFLCYNNYDGLHASGLHNPNRFRWLSIEQSNFGDTPEIFAAIMASGFIGDKIECYGKRKENKFIEYVGRNFPTITATAVGTYYALGEMVMPQILPGTPDIKDVPAVIITVLLTPFIANYIRKQWKHGWKDKIQNYIAETNKTQTETT